MWLDKEINLQMENRNSILNFRYSKMLKQMVKKTLIIEYNLNNKCYNLEKIRK